MEEQGERWTDRSDCCCLGSVPEADGQSRGVYGAGNFCGLIEGMQLNIAIRDTPVLGHKREQNVGVHKTVCFTGFVRETQDESRG